MNLGFNTFESLRGLKPGWNGYGAAPIPDNIVDRCVEISKLFTKDNNYEIFPTARETIQFEWHIDGIYVELEVFAHHSELFIDLGGNLNGAELTITGDEESLILGNLDKLVRKAEEI